MSLICAATLLIGFKFPMTKEDKLAYRSAKARCSVHYPDAPCLKKFIKREEQTYWAICGREDVWSNYKAVSPGDLCELCELNKEEPNEKHSDTGITYFY